MTRCVFAGAVDACQLQCAVYQRTTTLGTRRRPGATPGDTPTATGRWNARCRDALSALACGRRKRARPAEIQRDPCNILVLEAAPAMPVTYHLTRFTGIHPDKFVPLVGASPPANEDNDFKLQKWQIYRIIHDEAINDL